MNGSDSMSPTVPPISTISTSGSCSFGNHPDRLLDLVRDVRDHLDRLAEIIAAAFLFDDRKVDPAARPVVRLRKLRVVNRS